MTPRSLVGMTMGARRRRLWNEFFDEAWDGATIDDFRTESAKYRLGQRLRPCPGEYRCTKCSQNNWCRCTDTEADAACVICGVLQHWPCDGSGVLPARAKKVPA